MDKYNDEPLVNYDLLVEGYNILNSLKPSYFQTNYPFDNLTPEKIIFTKNKISIMAKEYEKFLESKKFKNNANDRNRDNNAYNRKHGGGPTNNKITFYD